jgi:hypothetical protein
MLLRWFDQKLVFSTTYLDGTDVVLVHSRVLLRGEKYSRPFTQSSASDVARLDRVRLYTNQVPKNGIGSFSLVTSGFRPAAFRGRVAESKSNQSPSRSGGGDG